MALQAPTFNGTGLCTTSMRQLPGPIDVRVHIELLPGVNGEFAQPQGHGGRSILVTGVLHTTAKNTRALAATAAYAELRTKERLADGTTVGDYVDPYGLTITNCILMTYSPAGQIEIVPVPGAATFKGVINIRCIIRELNP